MPARAWDEGDSNVQYVCYSYMDYIFRLIKDRSAMSVAPRPGTAPKGGPDAGATGMRSGRRDMAIRSWPGYGRPGTSPGREVPVAVRDAVAGGAARERQGFGDRRAASPVGPRCGPVMSRLRPRGLSIISVRPKTGDFAVVRCRRRVFSRRILRRVGIFSKKSSPSRAEKAASRDVGGLRATPKRPTSRVGYQNRNRPRLRGHQTSSTASTRFASQTLSFLTLQ